MVADSLGSATSSQLSRRLPPRRRRFVRSLAPLGLQAAAACVAGFVVVMLAGGRDAVDARQRIAAGDAAAVLAEIEEMPADVRGPNDELVRGHALLALARVDDALVAWTHAARRGAFDAQVTNIALARLSDDEPTRAAALIRALPDAAVVAPLAVIARDGAWWPRHRALALLEERSASAQVDLEAFALRDLAEGDSCGRRKAGLEMLRRHGRTRDTLAGLDAAQRADDGCLGRLIGPVRRSLAATIGTAGGSAK